MAARVKPVMVQTIVAQKKAAVTMAAQEKLALVRIMAAQERVATVRTTAAQGRAATAKQVRKTAMRMMTERTTPVRVVTGQETRAKITAGKKAL